MPEPIAIPEEHLERTIAAEWGIPVGIAAAEDPLDPADLEPGEREACERIDAPARRAAWLRGRRALKRVLSSLDRPTDTGALAFPHPRCSVAHSGGMAVAAGTVAADALGLGIDLELRRILPAAAARLFLSPGESRGADEPALLRLWTVKEACFKADPGNASARFADYVLDDPRAPGGRARTRAGGTILYRSFESAGTVLTVAVMRGS